MDDIYGDIFKVVSDFGGRANARNVALQIFTSSIDKTKFSNYIRLSYFDRFYQRKNLAPQVTQVLLKEFTAHVSLKIDEEDTFL